MSLDESQKKSQLIAVLREGVAVVQMVFFKEIKILINKNHPDMNPLSQTMLAGTITNELFGTPNLEVKFVQFRQEHKAIIEQELLGLAANLPQLRRYLTDALRVQTLCDTQEGEEKKNTLITADKLGILIVDRDIPLPSVFMTLVRGLGEKYQLIIPPSIPSSEDDECMVH